MRLAVRILLFLVVSALCVLSACAQSTAESPNVHKGVREGIAEGAQASDPALPATNSRRAAAMPQPSAEMTSVEKALSGRWLITMKFEPTAQMPKGAEGRGEEVWRAGPGGFTFMEEADDHMPSGEVFLTGFMWWDDTNKKFGGMLCTSANPRGCDPESALHNVHLSWDGSRLVVDIESEHEGKKSLWHEVFFDITPTSFTQTGEAGEPGGPLKRVVTIYATKIADEAQPRK
jgi:hypothetical protein